MTRAEAAGDASQRRGGEGGVPSVRRLRHVRFAARRSRWFASRPATPSYSDVNYVFPTFITEHMPIGMPGLLDRRHPRRGDVDDRRRAVGAVDGDGDRFLSPLRARRRRAIAHFLRVSRLATALLGPLRQRRRRVGGRARVADRGRQSFRVVLLRLDPRRLHPGRRLSARDGQWCVHRPVRRHGRGRPGPRARPTSRFSGTT